MHHPFFRPEDNVVTLSNNIGKGNLIMSEKIFTILKTLYQLGGKADSKEIYDSMEFEDLQKFNLHSPLNIMWSIRKPHYINRLSGQGTKYLDGKTPYGKYAFSKNRTVFELKPRVVEFIKKVLQE